LVHLLLFILLCQVAEVAAVKALAVVLVFLLVGVHLLRL
jgi:hypothetical protein